MSRRVSHRFFHRPADVVARELIGHTLCVQLGDVHGVTRLPITETEAYMGPHDLACHSAKGRTQRTEVMYQKAGTIYVYLIYGMYSMLNIVTGEKDFPAAVLIRGAGEYDGPGKLTRALGISRDINDSMLGKSAGVWIEEPKTILSPQTIQCTPRIGIEYAKEWAEKELRFVWNEGAR